MPGEDNPFAVALRTAISDRGLSLERIRYHLRRRGHEVSVATLSYWQSGRSRPDRIASLSAVGSLEEVLGVPRGQLASLLPPRRSARPTTTKTTAPEEGLPLGRVIGPMLDELGFDWDDGFDHLNWHNLMYLNRQRRAEYHDIREVIRARVHELERLPIWAYAVEPQGALTVTPRHGCRLGRVLRDEASGSTAWELLLDRPVRLGESVLIEYRLAASADQRPLRYWELVAEAPRREIHIAVTFQEDDLPDQIAAFTVVDGEEKEIPVSLTGRTASHLELDFGPGIVGMRWSWPDLPNLLARPRSFQAAPPGAAREDSPSG